MAWSKKLPANPFGTSDFKFFSGCTGRLAAEHARHPLSPQSLLVIVSTRLGLDKRSPHSSHAKSCLSIISHIPGT